MKITAIVIYAVSLLIFLRLKWLEKPKPLDFGVFGTLKPTSRDFYFIGSISLLAAIGLTFMLWHSASIGVISRWLDGPGISYVSVKDDPAQFKLQLYLQSAATPLLWVFGVRFLIVGHRLGKQT